MPGAYTHLTLVGTLAASNYLDQANGFVNEAKAALLRNTCFCDLGAVSPDYPYLKLVDKNSTPWADTMHREKAGDVIKKGVEEVRKLAGPEREIAFAWLLGYTAHVVTDVTIHPVVQLKVGPYDQNKTAHRVCEMNQDAYIFQRLNIGSIGLSEYLNSGLRNCSSKQNKEKLNPCITKLWGNLLNTCYPAKFKANKPDIDGWHSWFLKLVDKVEEGERLPAFSRHVAAGIGLTYPKINEIDRQYIDALKTPAGIMNYDEIFNRAKGNVLDIWSFIAAGVYKNDDAYRSHIENWNLDTGLNAAQKLAFWST